MIRGLICAAIALLLAGCGDLPVALDYSQKQTVVAADVPQFKLTKLVVSESPKHPGRIWVQPTSGTMTRLALNGYGDQWAALRPEIEPAYRQAASSFLTARGQTCELSEPMPYPTYLAFEFLSTCK